MISISTAHKVAQGLREVTGAHFTEWGVVRPVAYILADRAALVVAADIVGLGKDEFCDAVRAVCSAHQAGAVVLFAEAWIAPNTPSARAWSAQHQDLAACPEAREVLVCTLEHAQLAHTVAWRADIQRPAAGGPTLGLWEQLPELVVKGGRLGFIDRPVGQELVS